PSTRVIRKATRIRLRVRQFAARIGTASTPPSSVLSTVTPPGTLGMISGGNMKVGKIPTLDMTSHIAMITITNTTLLKMVVIAKFLLKHLFHFLFQFFHHAPFQVYDIAVGSVSRPYCLHGEFPLHCPWSCAHEQLSVRKCQGFSDIMRDEQYRLSRFLPDSLQLLVQY